MLDAFDLLIASYVGEVNSGSQLMADTFPKLGGALEIPSSRLRIERMEQVAGWGCSPVYLEKWLIQDQIGDQGLCAGERGRFKGARWLEFQSRLKNR